MNELGALLSILPYALSVALLAALLHRLAAWSEGPSLADLVSGPRDLPWPRGVQEEEPVRWDVQRLRRRAPARCGEEVPGVHRAPRPDLSVM